ncbi:MAG: HAD-IIA family hydrolase [Gammaproteobacteria bacterium]|nr:HAD-IIA family hydrolase [Gammaproteobacteria bacterium]
MTISIESFLVDIDGTVYDGQNKIPGAADALADLRRRGIPFLLVTNTSRMPMPAIMARLKSMRVEVSDHEVFAVPTAACDYIKRDAGDRCFVIGTPNIDAELTEAGLTVVRTEEPVDFVVISQYQWINFGEIDIAYRLIRSGAKPVAMHQDMTYPDNGVLRASLGPVVAALEALTGVTVTIVGKPNPTFFDLALARAGFSADKTIVIGDNLDSDIRGALNAGLRAIQVQTGAYAATTTSNAISPTWTLSSLADLPRWLDTQG